MLAENQSQADAAPQVRARRVPLWLLRVVETLAWSALIAAASAVLALRYWILPNIEDHRELVVGAFTRGLGLPVTVGRIHADWQGVRPRISFADLRVYDRDGREALVLPAVHNVLSWRSLATGRLRLASLVIDSPRLAMRRDAAGRLYVAGLELGAAGAVDPKTAGEAGVGAAEWILGQREIQVRNAEIEWVDQQRGAPPLKLSALDLRLRSAGGLHAIGISARPPQGFGTSLVLRAELDAGTVAVPEKWSGRLYLELGDTDLAAWDPWVDTPFDLTRGRGALRMWATLGAGRRLRSTLDVQLSDVVARLAPELPRLELASLAGRLEGRAAGGSFELSARDLALTLADGEALAPTSFRVSWTPKAEARPAPGAGPSTARGDLRADRIDLAPLARLGEFLPFPRDLRALLVELAPRGSLRDVVFDWTGELPNATQFRAQSNFEGLAMNAWRTVPGFSGITGRIEASPGRGRVELRAREVGLELPKLFPQPRIALDALSGTIEWDHPQDTVLRVKLSSIAFGNDHLAGSAFGAYRLGADGPGEIDLSVELTHADGRRTTAYLPLATIMGENTRAWLERAIVDGRASNVRFHLKGDLREFPFADPTRGQFLVQAKIDGAVVDYAAGWPKIEGIEGELRVERERIEITGQRARILGTRLANVRVSIPSLLAPTTDLLIEGQAAGPTREFLRFIEESPVRRMTEGFTVGMHAEGEGKLDLKLKLPLNDPRKVAVSGEFAFAAKRLLVRPEWPPLEKVRTKLAFSESSLSVRDFEGRLLGGPVKVSGGGAAREGLRLVAQGSADTAELRGLLGHPWLGALRGATAYEAEFAATPRGTPSFRVSTDLKGVESGLPEPLAKRADDALPLDVRVEPVESKDGAGAHRVAVALGKLVRAEFLRPRAKANGERSATPARMLILLNPPDGQTPPLPERAGLVMRGTLDALDLDAWRALPAGRGEGGGPAKIDLAVGVLDVYGKRLRQVQLAAGSDVGGWSAQVSADELEGQLAYRAEGDGLLVARLKRFRLPENAPRKPGAGAANPEREALPAMDLIAERFTLYGRELGRAEIAARPQAKVWNVDKLIVLNPDAELRGTGSRTLAAGASRTAMTLELKVTDVGKFLARVGYPKMVQGARAQLDAAISWNGEPQAIHWPSLEGRLRLKASDGQFLEIEPGLGKLVGLMSMQMLPRRITLDFRDVFSDGFKFDEITSTLDVTRGVMTTKDFQMNGPAAELEMHGQTDLAAETQDLKVKVVPSLGDTASAAVALLNPAIGAAALLAQRALKNPLGQILAYEYAVSGSWQDPQVKKLGVQPQPGGGAHVETP